MITHIDLLQDVSTRVNITSSFLGIITHWIFLKIPSKEAKFSIKIFITKWISGDTAYGRAMVRRQQYSNDS